MSNLLRGLAALLPIRRGDPSARRLRLKFGHEILEKRRMMSTVGVVGLDFTAPATPYFGQYGYEGGAGTGAAGSVDVFELDSTNKVETPLYNATLAGDTVTGSFYGTVTVNDDSDYTGVAVDDNGRVYMAGIPKNGMDEGIYALGPNPGQFTMLYEGSVQQIAVAPNGDVVGLDFTAPSTPQPFGQYGYQDGTGTPGSVDIFEVDPTTKVETPLYEATLAPDTVTGGNGYGFGTLNVNDDSSYTGLAVDANGQVVVAGIPENGMDEGIYTLGAAQGQFTLIREGSVNQIAVAPNGDVVGLDFTAPGSPIYLGQYGYQDGTGAAGSVDIFEISPSTKVETPLYEATLAGNTVTGGFGLVFGGGTLQVNDDSSYTALAVEPDGQVVVAGIPKNDDPAGIYTLGTGDDADEFTQIHDGAVTAIATPPPDEAVISTVTAADNDSTAADTFGNYLANVPLANTFTVKITAGSAIASVKYTLNGKTGIATAGAAGSGTWTFDPQVGNLTGDPDTTDPTSYPLVVTAYDSKGNEVGDPYKGFVLSQGDLPETVAIAPPGSKGPGVDVTSLRFLEGVSMDSDFTGSLDDLPSYYVPMLRIELGGKPLPGVTINKAGSVPTFTFTYDPADLVGDEVVFPTFAEPNGIVSAPGKDTTAKLHSVPLPAWMSVDDASWDEKAQDYVIHLTFPPGLSFSADPTAAFDSALLSALTSGLDLTSSGGIGAKLTVTAGLSKTGPANLTVDSWFAYATVLGQVLFDQSSTAADGSTLFAPNLLQAASGQLNPDTLAAVKGITLTTKPIDLLSLISKKPAVFTDSFGTGPRTLEIPTVPLLRALSPTIDLEGNFQAAATQLDLTLGLQFDVSGPTPMLVPSGSFAEIEAEGSASLTLAVGGGLSLLNQVKLGGAIAAAGASVVADADLFFRFSGLVTMPSATLDTDASTAGLTLGYGYDVTGSFFSDPDATELDPEIKPVGPVGLFGLEPSDDTPDFTDLHDLIIAGAATLMTGGKAKLGPALPSVPSLPTVPGVPTPDADFAASTGLSAEAVATTPTVAPTATLTVTTPVYQTTDALSFAIDVTSDHAALAAGHHFLDTVLVDPEGDVVPLSSIDLAGFKLKAATDTLGYDGGVETIDVPIDPSKLMPGVPYEIQFRFTNDLAGTGQAVAATLSDLGTATLAPALAVTTPGGGGSAVDFAPGATSATVQLANSGPAALVISSATFAGLGFTLASPLPASGLLIPSGESADLVVQVADPTAAASSTLSIQSDDPSLPVASLALSYAGPSPGSTRTAGPALAPISAITVDPGSPVVFTEAATDPGYAVTYGLAPGYPAGAQINPATGAFTWTPPALGTYSITILAIDDGPSAPVSRMTFAVDVVSPALVDPLSLSPVELGRYEAVTTLYDQILGRAPDAQGLLDWMAQLDSGVSIGQVARDFHASPERAALVAGHSAPAFSLATASSDASIHGARAAELATVYDEVLDRAPDLPGFLYWTSRLGRGASLATVAGAFDQSAERRVLIKIPGTPKLNLATVEGAAARNAAIVQATPRPSGLTTSG